MATRDVKTNIEKKQNFYSSLSQELITIARKKIELTKTYSEKHSFQVIKISEEEKQDILFIKSTIPTLSFL